MKFRYKDLEANVNLELHYEKINLNKKQFIENVNLDSNMSRIHTDIDESLIEVIPISEDETQLFAENGESPETAIGAFDMSNTLRENTNLSYANSTGNIEFTEDVDGYALDTRGVGCVDINFKHTLSSTTTVMFKIKKKFGLGMLFGGEKCGLKTNGNKIGFTTNKNDFQYTELALSADNNWIHVAVVFVANDVESSKLYIDGVLQTLSASNKVSNNNWVLDKQLRLSGTISSNSHRVKGKYKKVKIFNYELSPSAILQHAGA